MAVIGRSCLVNSCKIIHFGINPVRGGKPPSDNIVIIVMVTIAGALVQAIERVLMLVVEMVFSVINAVDVIII